MTVDEPNPWFETPVFRWYQQLSHELIRDCRHEKDGLSLKEGYTIGYLLNHLDRRFKYPVVEFVSECFFFCDSSEIRYGG